VPRERTVAERCTLSIHDLLRTVFALTSLIFPSIHVFAAQTD
jgi:hypothetical protein